MKQLRRCLAVMLSFAMIAAMAPLSSAEAVKAKEAGGLLAEYKFEDSDVTDKVLADAAGNGYDAALEGGGYCRWRADASEEYGEQHNQI